MYSTPCFTMNTMDDTYNTQHQRPQEWARQEQPWKLPYTDPVWPQHPLKAPLKAQLDFIRQ